MSSSVPHDWIGQTLADRYHVIEKIGAGGMGTVFKASDTRLGAEVVVKAPHPVMIKDAEFAARFTREIQSLVKLSHPNIVKVMDVGEHDGLPFVVMEYLSGGSLEDRQCPCRPRAVSAWLPDVADALDFMHSEGLVHRDIKPGNILFNSSGRAYLGDFGISKVVFESDGDELSGLTGTGTLIGTAEYMPPEILLPSRYGEVSDGRSDQYALAVTVYEMLSGRPPFRGDTIGEVSVRLATEEAVPLDLLATGIPESLSAVVGKALQKQPEDRYASCEAFANSYVAAVGGEPLPPVGGDRPAKREASASGTVPRQPTQVEATRGPEIHRTATIQEPVPGLSRRPTMPESVASPDLPGTKTGLGETEQHKPEVVGGDAAGGSVNRLEMYLGLLLIVLVVVVSAVGYMGSSSESFLGGSDSDATGPSNVSGGMGITNSIGMKLRLIPAGDFMMGSPETETDRDDDETRHRVTITQPFYLGETEVTQEQYEKVMGTNPSEFKDPQNPVEQVSWTNAVEFCRKLSAMPAEKTAGHVYRLPTEAEWEYACRAGTTTSCSFGDLASQLSEYGWFVGNSDSKTHPVGEKKPNAWGLYDMHGNVLEWCQDWYGNYPSGSVTDPTGATSGSRRVFRGGGWDHIVRFCRSAYRNRYTPEIRGNYLGFRVLRSSIK